MPNEHEVASHYGRDGLVEAIEKALSALGTSPSAVGIDDLAAVDEFHIGGRNATEDLLRQIDLPPGAHVLDVGCGIGGPARVSASRFGWQVTGIDLTQVYIEAGETLSGWVGFQDHVSLRQASALDMPFTDSTFDAAYMIHVGMNIEDKAGVFAEVARTLRPGAKFAVYDVMRTGEGNLDYPVPWAATSETSALSTPEEYKALLQAAGFEVTAERNRRQFALDFFTEMSTKIKAAGGPPPLGLHILMGPATQQCVQNMVANIASDRIAPVEIIAHKI